jgi:glycosyltransferase involved in cell wall biosynthesis
MMVGKKVNISIIVPIYNVDNYIRTCLDSLAEQTLDSIEVLLVNDGTQDNSGEIAQEYARKWPERFRYFVKENGGLSDARNYAFPYVMGEYMAYVDSDDYVEKTMYEKLWKAAEKSHADIIECELYKVYSNHYERIHLLEKYKSIQDYMLNARVCAWNKLYRTEWIREIGVEFPKGLLYEDVCFFSKITPYLTQMPVTVHESLYFYRQRDGSILSSSNRRIVEIHDVFDNIFRFYHERNLSVEYEQTAEYKYIKTLFCSFLLRMLQMKDQMIRAEVIDLSWNRINTTRPQWRKNKYLKAFSIKNLYLCSMSKPVLMVMKRIIK